MCPLKMFVALVVLVPECVVVFVPAVREGGLLSRWTWMRLGGER